MSSPWHSQDMLNIVRVLRADLKTGLTAKEAMARVQPNQDRNLIPYQEHPAWKLALRLAWNPRTLLLLAAALAYFVWSGVAKNSAASHGILFLGIAAAEIGLRTLQRILVGRRLQELHAGTLRKARVLRDGVVKEVEPHEVVVGDILRLRAGDAIPADARLFLTNDLRVNQAPLTGINDPAEKAVEDLEGELPLQEQRNMVFGGSFVHSGTASAVVVATGQDRILFQLYSQQRIELPYVPAYEPIAKFTPKLAWLAVLAALLIAALLFRTDEITFSSTFQALSVGVAFFLACIPVHAELTVTILFVQSLRQLSRTGATVQDEEALDRLSLATTLCFDAQGVITTDEMTVQNIYLDGEIFSGEKALSFFHDDATVTPHGDAEPSAEPPTASSGVPTAGDGSPADLYFLFVAAAMCAMNVESGEEGWEALDPLAKKALLKMAATVGVDTENYKGSLFKVGELPFDANRRRQSVLFRTSQDRGFLFVLGTGETVLNHCRVFRYQGVEDVLQSRQREALLFAHDHLRAQASQVVAIAYKKVSGNLDKIAQDLASHEDTLTFIGMMSFTTALRPDIKETVDHCQRAGLRLVVMSDSDVSVAFRLARDAALVEHRSQVLSDEQLRMMDDDTFITMIDRITVYAQLKGEQKARVVQLLRRKGHRVAFIGRRLYDIPALRSADVSLAPGELSVDAAAHEADIIVNDCSLPHLYRVLKVAKDAGNILRRSVHWLLSVHWGLSLFLAVGLALGATPYAIRVPLEFSHVAWLQLMLFTFPFTVAAHELRQSGARRWTMANRNVRTGIKWSQVLSHGGILALISLVAGAWMRLRPWDTGDRDLAIQTVTMMTFLVSGLAFLVRSLAGHESPPRVFIKANPLFIVGVLLTLVISGAVVLSPLVGLFGLPVGETFGALPLSDKWLLVLLAAAVAWFVPHSE